MSDTALKMETFTLGPLATNAYLLLDEREQRALIIDPGMEPEPLLKRIESLQIEAILLTHAHFDHIGGVEYIRKWKNCPVYVHENEADWLTDADKNGSTLWPEISSPIRTSPAEHVIREEGLLTVMDMTFRVLHTPGHSPGSVSYLYENRLFSGDVLFQHSIGRTDLPGGSSMELYASIHEKLFKLSPETEIWPGHGPGTTIGREMKHNPFV